MDCSANSIKLVEQGYFVLETRLSYYNHLLTEGFTKAYQPLLFTTYTFANVFMHVCVIIVLISRG